VRRAALLCACLLLAAFPARAQQPQPLGRLFFTPEQREALDARRRARVPDKPAAAVAASPTTRVDGFVKRSSGKSTLWLDGYPVRDGSQPEGLRVQGSRDPGRVTLIVGEDRRAFELRVGETLDRGTGEIKDPLGGGEIRVRRGGARAR
jgi:hypothetical protein